MKSKLRRQSYQWIAALLIVDAMSGRTNELVRHHARKARWHDRAARRTGDSRMSQYHREWADKNRRAAVKALHDQWRRSSPKDSDGRSHRSQRALLGLRFERAVAVRLSEPGPR